MATGLTLLGIAAAAIVGGGALVYVVMMYNGLVRLNKNIDKAMSNIDVLLKQRNDEIPKLVDAAQQYMDYEKDTLDQITEARTKVEGANNPRKKAEADQMMKNALGNFFAVAEDYPDLKSTEQFQQLQNRISEIEEQIADRREFYNSSVTTYNTRISQIPYNFLANSLGYTEKEVFEATEEEKQDVNIGEQFNN
jgi:LemA protein